MEPRTPAEVLAGVTDAYRSYLQEQRQLRLRLDAVEKEIISCEGAMKALQMIESPASEPPEEKP